jgi:hypothetical protein
MNFFISSFRFKIACVSFFGAALSVVNALLNGTPAADIIGKYGFSIGLMLLLSAVLWRPAFTYVRTDPKLLWQRWGTAACTSAAEESEEVRFERFYPKTKYALTRDPTGYRVATTLLKCTCIDFRKKRMPCKHMFKLARLTGALAEENMRTHNS